MLGGLALNWCLAAKKRASIDAWRGHRFPFKLADFVTWIFPLYHPAFVLRKPQYNHVFKLDVENAYKFLERNIAPVVIDPKLERSKIRTLYNLNAIIKSLDYFETSKFVSIDLETNSDRPYYTDASIITISVGCPELAIAFPWRYPQYSWSTKDFILLKKHFRQFIHNCKIKYAHNLAFELEFLSAEYDPKIVRDGNWRDTMAAAFLLGYGGNEKSFNTDEGEISRSQRGLLSLDNLCKAYFGFFLKAISNVDRKNLVKEPLEEVLIYNSYDALLTSKLAKELENDVTADHMEQIYAEHCRRISTVVLTQKKGLLCDLTVAQQFNSDYREKLNLLATSILKNPAVIEYQTKFNKFDPNSPRDVALFFKYLGFKVEKEGRLCADEEILKAIDHPVAKDILTIRELIKLSATYLAPLVNKEVVFPDTRLHTQFSTLFTTSARISSSNPNCQNFPKRKNSHIRKVIVPPSGYIMCSNDYGQIEARMIAMLSRDKYFVNALWNNLDVHAEWSEILARLYPARIGGNIDEFLQDKVKFKAFRDVVKNRWVFPLFFGASVESSAAYMNIPISVADEAHKLFWSPKYFAGIKAWQETLYNFYRTKGYVETPTGRRRRMYLEGGEIINFPVQSTSADIMIDAMNRLSEYAMETGQDDFQPILTLHDDLTFYLKQDKYEESIALIAKMMLDCKFDFINVPLTVESSIGPNWGELIKYRVFSSNEK